MRIVHETVLINSGRFSQTAEWTTIQHEIRQAVAAVVWPPGERIFTINPIKKGNGVKPIKEGCMLLLKEQFGWRIETKQVRGLGKIDAIRESSHGVVALEWETGNVSSSHRAINKIILGITQETLIGGILVVPTRRLYRYLTDRIGNYEELEPYFPVWCRIPVVEALVMVIAIEQEAEDERVPLITKGTDGRALV